MKRRSMGRVAAATEPKLGRLKAVLVAALGAMMLAACGGASAPDADNAFAQRIATEGRSAPRQVLGAATGSADAAVAPAPAAAATALPSAKELFDWAEYRFPDLLYPRLTQPDYTLVVDGQRYTVRSYPSGNHVGMTTDGRIYGLGPFTGQVLMSFGNVADYAALIAADRCRVYLEACFTAGPARTLAVNVGAGGTVTDSVTGAKLLFPAGGSGQVTLAPLTATPTPPQSTPGSAWRIEYSGTQAVEIVLDGAFDGSGNWPAVYRYEALSPGAVDDGRGTGARWVPAPVRQLAAGRYAFELRPATTGMAAADGAPADARRKPLASANATTEARNFYIAQMARATTDVDKRLAQYGLAGTYFDQVVATLSPALAQQVKARRAERLPSWGNDGNYYRGFSFFITRRLYPQINVTLDNFSLAHENGHYITHMLVGHDVYERLEAQSYPELHGPPTVVGRGVINEDYAFTIEQFLIGKGGNNDLREANTFLRDSKAGADLPAVEGFAAAMLTSLVRSSTSIPSFDSRTRTTDVPVIGLSYGQVFGIIAQGATDVNALRQRVEATLDADGQQRLLVNLQRLGWRYSATLRVVDAAGLPVANADTRLLVRVGSSEYLSDSGRTDAEGRLNLWFAFPGTSTLSVSRAGETLEGQVAIDWTRPTNERIALGDVRVAAAQTFARLREVCVSFSYTTITAVSRIEDGPFTRVECVQPPPGATLNWSGNRFSIGSGQTYIEGLNMPTYNMITSVKARRPLSGNYKTTPPLFEIMADQVPRDMSSALVRFKFEGQAANGRWVIHYQPEDDCLGGYCEARAVKAIDGASVSLWVTFFAE